MNFQMFKLVLKKGRGNRDQIDNIHWIIEKGREFHKIIYFCFIDYAKAFDCVDHNKLWTILQVRLQQYVNSELPDVQARFRKGRGSRDQIANICWIIKKARVPEKHLLLLY